MNALAGPADQVTDQIGDGFQRLVVVLVYVLGAEPGPDLSSIARRSSTIFRRLGRSMPPAYAPFDGQAMTGVTRSRS